MNTAAFQSSCKQAVLDIIARQGGGMLMVDATVPKDRLSIGVRLLRRAGLLESTGVDHFWQLTPKAVAVSAAA